MEERYLSLAEACEVLGKSERTLYRWIKAGKLKAYKPGRDYEIPVSAIREMRERSEVYPKALRSSLEPSFNDVLAGERRTAGVEVGEAYIVPLEEGEEPDTVTLRLYTVRLLDERDRLLQEVRRLEREKAAMREELEKAERARE